MKQKSLDATFYLLKGRGIFAQGDDAVCAALEEVYGEESNPRREDFWYNARIPGYTFDVAGIASFIPTEKTAPVGGIGWFINNLAKWDLLPPPYVSTGEMGELMKQFIFRKPADPLPLLTEVLSKVFTTAQLARYQVEMYEKFDVFRGFEKTTDECIKAFELGLNSIAIVGLIPVLEGVLRNIGEREIPGFQGSTSKEAFLKLIDHLAMRVTDQAYSLYEVPAFMKQPDYIGSFHDQIQMLNAFRAYFETRLYENTARVVGPIDLNRHSVLHGLVSDFDKPINFYRLVIAINFLGWTSFVLGHTESTTIALPETALSRDRAQAYLKYKAIGASLQPGGKCSA